MNLCTPRANEVNRWTQNIGFKKRQTQTFFLCFEKPRLIGTNSKFKYLSIDWFFKFNFLEDAAEQSGPSETLEPGSPFNDSSTCSPLNKEFVQFTKNLFYSQRNRSIQVYSVDEKCFQSPPAILTNFCHQIPCFSYFNLGQNYHNNQLSTRRPILPWWPTNKPGTNTDQPYLDLLVCSSSRSYKKNRYKHRPSLPY